MSPSGRKGRRLPILPIAGLIFLASNTLRVAFNLRSDPIDATAVAVRRARPDTEDDCFSLCDVTLCVRDMPPIDRNTTFGYPGGWTRNSSHAIVPDNHTKSLFGETGNNIREFFHAMDLAHESGSELVVHPSGFPVDTLKRLFSSDIDGKLLNSIGVTMFNPSHDYAEMKVVFSTGLFSQRKKHMRQSQIANHRRFVLQRLYRHLGGRIANSSDVRDHFCSARQTLADGSRRRSVVIHSRSHFYRCLNLKFEIDEESARTLPPEFVVNLIEQTNLTVSNSNILMIHDGSEAAMNSSERLASDPATSRFYQSIPHAGGNPESDMLLAILSDLFIGNPSSTFAWYIAQVRHALGLGPSRLFYKRDNRSNGNVAWAESCTGETCLYKRYCSTYG